MFIIKKRELNIYNTVIKSITEKRLEAVEMGCFQKNDVMNPIILTPFFYDAKKEKNLIFRH